MRRPVGVKSVLLFFRWTRFYSSRRVSHCRHASIRTLKERIVSLGACWAFSIQPALLSVWRPVVSLSSGTWPRPLTRSPELGFGFCLSSSWNDFDFAFAVGLRSCRQCHSVAVVQGLVHFSAHPQVMQQHRQLSCRSHDRSLLSVSSATLASFNPQRLRSQ